MPYCMASTYNFAMHADSTVTGHNPGAQTSISYVVVCCMATHQSFRPGMEASPSSGLLSDSCRPSLTCIDRVGMQPHPSGSPGRLHWRILRCVSKVLCCSAASSGARYSRRSCLTRERRSRAGSSRSATQLRLWHEKQFFGTATFEDKDSKPTRPAAAERQADGVALQHIQACAHITKLKIACTYIAC